MPRKLLFMLIAVISIYLLTLVFLFFFQRNLQYLPSGKLGEISQYSLDGFEEKILTTKDSLKILAWLKKPAQKNQKIILYFHGNAGNLGDRANKFGVFAADGFGILAISYRGYLGSQGKPSESGLMLDADAALKFLFEQGFAAKDIILFGESLGSGVAVRLATKFDFAAVILESPYSSLVSVAQKKYWFAPVNLLLKDKFESIKFAPKILAPVLIVHGTADKVVFYEEGEKLFDAIKSRKQLVAVKNAAHLEFSNEFLLEKMRDFLVKKSEM